MTDPIKAKIQELCPDVIDKEIFGGAGKELGSPITLAVVLRAMSKVGTMTKGANWLINLVDLAQPNIRWNLKYDNYDQQSEECKQFIGSLLGF